MCGVVGADLCQPLTKLGSNGSCRVDRRIQRYVQRRRWRPALHRKQGHIVVVAGGPQQQFKCVRTESVDGPCRGVEHKAATAAGDAGR
ncbi:hypothetical protein MRGA327_08560 [Mycobacterium tuberculosis RGTB327]|nr:hypothetical protein MRGA327_08560 [Mycobacterium tuberculosis RGTB327]